MRLWSDSFTEGGLLPAECAFACIDPVTRVRLSNNRNPHLAWEDVPAAAHSLVLLCRDVDAPASGDQVNQAGQVVPLNLPRADFFHWLLLDIPLELHALAEGQFSQMVTPHGKRGPLVPFTVKNGIEHQLRQGLNDYSNWFAGDPDMAGEYYGYDGPFPPWNDERPHAYVFTLYAIDTPTLPLADRLTGPAVQQALHGHILDEAQIFCVYSLNPHVAASL